MGGVYLCDGALPELKTWEVRTNEDRSSTYRYSISLVLVRRNLSRVCWTEARVQHLIELKPIRWTPHIIGVLSPLSKELA